MSLFPGPVTKSPYLLEFKAGRMKRQDKLVSPDTRKGIIGIYQADDSLMHFIWKDRKSNKTDDDSDLIVFPEEAEFRKVKQTAQRVYMLLFKGSNKKLFFWMQEANDEKDDELVKKVNWLLNNPREPGSIADPFEGMDEPIENGAMEEDKESEEKNDNQAESAQAEQQHERLNDQSSSSTTNQPSVADMALLHQFLKGIKMPDTADLSQVLSPEALAPLVNNDETLERLKPFLPPPHTMDAVNAVIRSPQFAQAVQAFNAAIKSGSVTSESLGIPPNAQGSSGVEAFLRALQNDVDRSSTNVAAEEGSTADQMEDAA